jgi:hypothetical protein
MAAFTAPCCQARDCEAASSANAKVGNMRVGTENALAANKATCPKLRIDSTVFQPAHYSAIPRDDHAYLRHNSNVKKF